MGRKIGKGDSRPVTRFERVTDQKKPPGMGGFFLLIGRSTPYVSFPTIAWQRKLTKSTVCEFSNSRTEHKTHKVDCLCVLTAGAHSRAAVWRGSSRAAKVVHLHRPKGRWLFGFGVFERVGCSAVGGARVAITKIPPPKAGVFSNNDYCRPAYGYFAFFSARYFAAASRNLPAGSHWWGKFCSWTA